VKTVLKKRRFAVIRLQLTHRQGIARFAPQLLDRARCTTLHFLDRRRAHGVHSSRSTCGPGFITSLSDTNVVAADDLWNTDREFDYHAFRGCQRNLRCQVSVPSHGGGRPHAQGPPLLCG
jgi:hypothetical protein